MHENVASSKKNVLRGMHFQCKYPQGKLLNLLVGKIYDVVIDLRVDSPSYGNYVGNWLEAKNYEQLYIPPGCAHGYYVVSERALLHYKCTEYYHPEDESGVMWDDPVFNIEWPLLDLPILSKKDQAYPAVEMKVI